MNLLTPFQQTIVEAISKSQLRDQFYLTGGTALGVVYLQHRSSLDFDFFTTDPTAVSRVPTILEKIAKSLDAQVTFTRTLGTFLQCFFQNSSSHDQAHHARRTQEVFSVPSKKTDGKSQLQRLVPASFSYGQCCISQYNKHTSTLSQHLPR